MNQIITDFLRPLPREEQTEQERELQRRQYQEAFRIRTDAMMKSLVIPATVGPVPSFTVELDSPRLLKAFKAMTVVLPKRIGFKAPAKLLTDTTKND